MKISVLDKSTLGEDIDLSPIYALGEVEEFETTAPDEIMIYAFVCLITINA